MPSLGVEYSVASSVHGVDETVDEGHRNLGPDSVIRLSELSCSCRPWSNVIESPLNLIPQMFNGVKVRTEGRPWKSLYPMLMEEVSRCSGSVRTGVVMLEGVVSMTTKMGYDEGSQRLIDVAASRNTVSSTTADILEHHRA